MSSTFYRGAGVLFVAPNKAGNQQILLGERSQKPFKGRWSVPGGRMDPADKGDFRSTAAREVCEETVGVSKLVELQDRIRLRLEDAEEHRIHAPFLFDFRIFAVPLTFQPDLRLWPNLYHWQTEFTDFDWFDPARLPKPLHPGMRKAIIKLTTMSYVAK